MFPAAFSRPPRVAIERTNRVYKGWDVRLDRLFFANAIRTKTFTSGPQIYAHGNLGDPWKDATISATRINVKSTPQQPIAVSDGFHCSDLGTASGVADSTVRAVQLQALASMKSWLATWKANPKPREVTPERARVAAAPEDLPYDGEVKPINAFVKGSGTA